MGEKSGSEVDTGNLTHDWPHMHICSQNVFRQNLKNIVFN